MSFAAGYYVFFIGVFLPVLCVRSLYKLKAGARFPPKPTLRKQTFLVHGLTLLLAWFTWRSFGLPLFPSYSIQWKDAALGLGALVVLVCGMYPMWKSNAVRKRAQVYRNLPQAPGEMGLWIAVSLSAGFVEEIVYRGVLFGILMYWTRNWWAAAILCAVVFALSHVTQGWKSAAIIFFIAIAFHGIVRFTGTLYVAMVVHAIYDIIAGFAYLNLYKQTTPEAAAPAPAGVV
jgi:membrane protease YdiL (CAAX protease family)